MAPSEDSYSPHSALTFIAVFEGGLVFFAAFVGWIIGVDPLAVTSWSSTDFGWGAVALIPLIAFLLISVRSRWNPLQRIRETVDEVVERFFSHANWLEIAVIAALAGLGEEMLFRGVVQAGISEWIGGNTGLAIGLVAASFAFGAGHAVHVPYFAFATLMGAYFGALFLYFDNLLVPIVVHALYDFIAIVYLRSRLPLKENDAYEEPAA